MSADPRILKQLLMAQWINYANPLDPSPPLSSEDGSLFQTLLGDLMASSSSDLPLSQSRTASALPGYGLSLDSLYAGLSAGQGVGESSYGESGSAYDGLIEAAAAKYGLDPALVKGVIQTESGFRAGAVSPAGAKGLMQLMDDTARGLGVQDVWDPAQNIDGGTRFLSYLLRKYDGNVSSALAAYNAGPGRVDRLGLVNDQLVSERLHELPEETQSYIRKVLTAARQWGMST